jgi:hypothetical protein
MDYLDKIIAYESGDLDENTTIELFAQLITDGSAWTLQGHYGRTASQLISLGIITRDGTINWDTVSALRAGETVELQEHKI